jgi:hypothetical protein
VVQLLTQPGAIFQAAPVRTIVYADYMAKVGFIKPPEMSHRLATLWAQCPFRFAGSSFAPQV